MFSLLGRTSDRKLWVEGLTTFALSPGSPPYKIAVYVPGRKVSLGCMGMAVEEVSCVWKSVSPCLPL